MAAAAARVPVPVPVPHKARASTPIDSSDSAYSRSPSEHSSEGVDHTYMNLPMPVEDETRFEDFTENNGLMFIDQ